MPAQDEILGEQLSGLPGCKDGMAERFYGLIARRGKLGGLRTLRKYPRGIQLDANQPGDYCWATGGHRK